MNRDFTRYQKLPDPTNVLSHSVGTRSNRAPISSREVRDVDGTRPYHLQRKNQGEGNAFTPSSHCAQQPISSRT
jgi:hypothetical protein